MKTASLGRGFLLGMALLGGVPLSAAAKCRGPGEAGRPLLVLDGRQTSEAELTPQSLVGDSIEAVHILCWNPADSTFAWSHGPQGVAAGVGVIRIVTRGLVDRLVAELYRVSDASRPNGASSDAPPSDSATPGATDEEIVVQRTADGTQWSATLRRGAMVHRCVLDAGRPSPSSTSERQRSCDFSIAEGEKHAMSTEG
jgi:hypothetical protein